MRGKEYRDEKKKICLELAKMPDFDLEISWQVVSPVPGVHSLLKRYSDVPNFKIFKRGDMFNKLLKRT